MVQKVEQLPRRERGSGQAGRAEMETESKKPKAWLVRGRVIGCFGSALALGRRRVIAPYAGPRRATIIRR